MSADPYKIDFASLRTFQKVFELKSFSEAALALDINQSVVSYTIDRMRSALGDSLFVRHGGGIAPTARCIEVAKEATELLQRYESLITPEALDPASLRYKFTVSCNHFERRWALPLMVRALRLQAPLVRLEVMTAGANGASHLTSGAADILVGPMRPENEQFYCRTLLREEYVCIMDRENALVHVPLTAETYSNARHVLVAYGDGWTSSYLTQLALTGFELKDVPVTVPSPGAIEDLIIGTDLIATVPLRFAMMLPRQIHIVSCPCPAPFSIDLVWSTRTHDSTVHRWLRNLIADALRPVMADEWFNVHGTSHPERDHPPL